MIVNDNFFPHDALWQVVVKRDTNGNPQLINYYVNRGGELVFQHIYLYDNNGDYLEGGIVDIKKGEAEVKTNNVIFN